MKACQRCGCETCVAIAELGAYVVADELKAAHFDRWIGTPFKIAVMLLAIYGYIVFLNWAIP